MEYFLINDEEEHRKEGRDLHFLENIINYLISRCKLKYPNIYKLCISNKKPTKRIARTRSKLAFLIGTFYGFTIFYLTVYQVNDMPYFMLILMLSLLTTIISIGMACFSGVRCIMTLIIFNFVTSAGKVMLTNHVISNMASGPINYTFINLRSTGASLICNYELFKNLTNAGNDQQMAQNDFLKKSFNNSEVKNRVRQSQKLTQNVSMMAGKRMRRSTQTNSLLMNQNDKDICKESVRSQVEDCKTKEKLLPGRCKKSIQNAKILNRVKIGLISLIKSINCEAIFDKHTNCEPVQSCNDNVSYSYENNLEALNLDFENNFDPTVNVSLNFAPIDFEATSLENLTKIQIDTLMIQATVTSYISQFELILQIIQVLVNFSYILAFVNSYKFYSKYVSNISFDNFCVCQHFRSIDSRRLDESKRTLLPLKNFETKELNYPFELFVSAYQKANVKIMINVHLIMFLMVLVMLLINWILADFLGLLKVISHFFL